MESLLLTIHLFCVTIEDMQHATKNTLHRHNTFNTHIIQLTTWKIFVFLFVCFFHNNNICEFNVLTLVDTFFSWAASLQCGKAAALHDAACPTSPSDLDFSSWKKKNRFIIFHIFGEIRNAFACLNFGFWFVICGYRFFSSTILE